MSKDLADQGLARIIATLPGDVDGAAIAAQITTGSFADDLGRIATIDWMCEAIVENLAAKRGLLDRVEPLRHPGSIVTTNTSGIPLHDLAQGQPARLRRDLAVTHFFNPVRIMKLVELVAGTDTDPETIESLAHFFRDRLGKGVVHAKDTVNFIGNRIGCYWILSGFHIAKPFLGQGLNQETIDALMGAPVGLPATGLYGLADLIGLDVMALIARNLAANLPADDPGLAVTSLPPAEAGMLERGQFGRKSGGGFTRVSRNPDGSRSREVFDLTTETWRPAQPVQLHAPHTDAASLLFADDPAGHFAWTLLGGTLLYAADLVPAIADDIVNIDRAMRWGFNWRQGPFELLDLLGPDRVIARLEHEGRHVPSLLQTLRDAGVSTFYRNDGSEFLGRDGAFHRVPSV